MRGCADASDDMGKAQGGISLIWCDRLSSSISILLAAPSVEGAAGRGAGWVTDEVS